MPSDPPAAAHLDLYQRLAALNTTTLQLSELSSLDELLRAAVELGVQQLAFDRLAVRLVADRPGYLQGSYGIDHNGQLRAEHDYRYEIARNPDLQHYLLQPDQQQVALLTTTIDDVEPPAGGDGWSAIIGLTAGTSTIGYLIADNLLSQRPYSAYQGELLALYATLLSHLCSRQQIEESLRMREKSYRTLVEAIPDYLFVIERTGMIQHYYEAQSPTLPTPFATFVGKSVADVFPEALAAQYAAAIEQAFATKQIATFEYKVHVEHADDQPLQVEPSLSGKQKSAYVEVRVTAGDDDRAIVLLRDVTERKLLEQQLHAAQKMESLGRMASGVAHDFNNYLTVIQGFSGLALEMAVDAPPRLHNALERISTASTRAARLTSQLLLFARKQTTTPQRRQVNTLISELHPILLPLLSERIELKLTLDDAAGYVDIDPSQFEQLLINLAVNARDAMSDSGRLTIATFARTLADQEPSHWGSIPPNQYAVIEVRDTGIGIASELLQPIFEPFFTTKAVEKGTGLGLSICHSIVEQNEGYIRVDSLLGEGTTFKIYLPQKSAPRAKETVSEKEEQTGGMATILLVEDDAPVREVVEEVLAAHGYTVIACSTGKDALEIASDPSTVVDLLMTDMAMPHMGGREVAEKFLGLRPETPVLLVSGYVDELPEKLISRSNVRFLPKPYTAVTLTGAVQRSINR